MEPTSKVHFDIFADRLKNKSNVKEFSHCQLLYLSLPLHAVSGVNGQNLILIQINGL